jgi:hypothetical protein
MELETVCHIKFPTDPDEGEAIAQEKSVTKLIVAARVA